MLSVNKIISISGHTRSPQKSLSSPILEMTVTENHIRITDDEIKQIYNDYSSKIIASKGEEKGRAFLMRKGIRLKGVDYDG